MIRNTRVQMLAVLVVGSLLGYLAASSQFSSRHAEASPTTPLAVEKPITPPAGKPACCEIIEGDLIAQATATAAAQTGAFGGKVQSANRPISGSTVTLYAASEGEPVQLAQGMTGEDGTFKLDVGAEKLKGAVDKVLYVVARGGTPKAGKGPNDAAALMALLGTILPETVTINELTTVASTFTAARFINGESVSGKPLGLRIAAGNVPNLVDPATGGWGKVLLDPLNCTQTTTLANLNTLGSLLSAFFTVADDALARPLPQGRNPGWHAGGQKHPRSHGRHRPHPWANPKALYALFDEAYPQPQDGARRKAPFVPYLALTPNDFALSLCFSGGGNYSAGKLCFDANGNLWSGQNWLPGSQSGVIRSIGGGTIKFAPNGTALSPRSPDSPAWASTASAGAPA